ncbi:MAG: hypothetical protein LQ352_002447 [Teloschistes flavicans]|nr:MAG: hypothetical protein LQ352_002447 [Teloschistes flavicans]
MDSVVFQDSPLALYLEGDGEANNNEWAPTSITQIDPPPNISSFAPQGPPNRPRKLRRKPPRLLNLDQPTPKGTVAQFHDACSVGFKTAFCYGACSLFDFRYTIIASQLLNDVPNSTIYTRHHATQNLDFGQQNLDTDAQVVQFTWPGLALTVLTAFSFAWLVQWMKAIAQSTSQGWPMVLTPITVVATCFFLYVHFRQQWLHWLRDQAVQNASTLVASAQDFQVAASSSINLIQEVELVCRGYRVSPLPPITRIEEQGQIRRCESLRRSLQGILASLPSLYCEAFEEMKGLAVATDLEKYYDMYEISRTDMLEIESLKDAESLHSGEETLLSFKIGLQKLHLARKLFLCSILALSADGGRTDVAKWASATKTMNALSNETSKATQALGEVLEAEIAQQGHLQSIDGTATITPAEMSVPATPKCPLTPGRERLRRQTRKLSSLSQGIRGLQASIHILREDVERSAGNSVHSSALMIPRYDSVGAEIKELLDEWQEGQAAFANTVSPASNRLSLPAVSKTTPSSPTISLGGLTAVDGSPPDAFRVLTGDGQYHQAASSTATSSAGEEIFEAVALPRQQSTLSREERVAKTKEDRIRQAMTKTQAQASTHMLKELETVIKMRPRGRTTGRITSV